MANQVDSPIGYDPTVETWRPHLGNWVSSCGRRILAESKFLEPIPDTERRHWPRRQVRIDACLKLQETTWRGAVSDISLGGVSLSFLASIPAVHNQSLEISLLTEAGVLEIEGAIRGIREAADVGPSGVRRTRQSLAVEFHPLDMTTELILASFIDAQAEAVFPLRLTGRLKPCESGDLLIDQNRPTPGSQDRSRVVPDSGIPLSLEDDIKLSSAAKDPLPSPEPCTVTSALIRFPNSAGRMLVGYHDSPDRPLPGHPVVVVSPGYGETKKEHLTLAYYLAANGFQVIRYDHTNHVGESEGTIVDTTLSRMFQDLRATVDYADRTWPASPIAVIATSLAGRVALKAVGQDPRVAQFVLIAGIMDVGATLHAVHQEDLVGDYLQGTRRGVTNVLGFNVELDNWLEDAVKSGYADLASTIQDAGRIRIPMILFAPEHDAWVSLDSVKRVLSAFPSSSARWFVIPEGLHRLQENPRKARAVFRQIAACCLDRFGPQSNGGTIAEPSRRDIGLQNRMEREKAHTLRDREQTYSLEFWQDYLDHFHYIVNFADYKGLLDHIYRLMGPVTGGQRILDAGCGNGNFGMFLLMNQMYRCLNGGPDECEPIHYLGVDFVPSALMQARLTLARAAEEYRERFSGAVPAQPCLDTSLARVDLNQPLPFRDNQFDRIVSNLVIGYLQDPLRTLQELLRVLRPEGRLVLTNLKPQADLSQIYRNFVQRTEHPREREEAQQLLNNSGKIRQGESDGVFLFYERHELAALLTACGAGQIRIYSTFANQAYLATVDKFPSRRVFSGECIMDNVHTCRPNIGKRITPMPKRPVFAGQP